MKILHLLASPVFSGPAENVALLAQAQRELGHQVSIAIDRKRAGLSAEEAAAPPLAARHLLDERGLELCVKSSLAALWRDMNVLKRCDADVLHTHFTHDHWLARWARPKGAVLIRSLHAPRSLRRVLPDADAFTVPSEAQRAALKHRPVQVLPALVDPHFQPPADRDALRATLGLSGAPLVGMVSTFQASRNHTLGLTAFAQLHRQNPAARMVLVGDGVLEDSLRQRVEALQLREAVTFAGYQKGEDFVRRVQALDEVWILGLGNDWSGRAAAQAKACGVRVVTVDEGALSVHADALIHPLSAEALLRASLEGARRGTSSPGNRAIAESILALYAQAKARPS